jgi:regulator of nucleoside diphosphate kinase
MAARLATQALRTDVDRYAITYGPGALGRFRPGASSFVIACTKTGVSMSTKPAIVISRLDIERIEALLERMSPTQVTQYDALRAELDRADVVEPSAIPADVVTMNSVVTFKDEDSSDELTISLVYPSGAGVPGTVSILAPVGSALLGLRVGQQIEWPTPDGHMRTLRVLEIEYQPEASGDLHR